MAYTQNPNMPKVRMGAVRLVKYRGWSMRKVARRYGVEPSTISRWCKHYSGTGWVPIHTRSSAPKTHPNALDTQIIKAVIQKRTGRRRCGQVIHQELLRDGVKVSLPSVQRTLNRLGMLKKRSPWKKAPFKFEMIQTDHGSEFSIRFTHRIQKMKISHRHSRVRQCNDNAHIERFNRTLQDECLRGVPRTVASFKRAIGGYLPYYINERMHMGIDFKTPAQMLSGDSKVLIT